LPLVPPPPAPEPLPEAGPLSEDDPMLTIAFRRPGTAMAVPVNRNRAATAMTGLSQAGPIRSRTAWTPAVVAAAACPRAVEVPAATVAAIAAASALHRRKGSRRSAADVHSSALASG